MRADYATQMARTMVPGTAVPVAQLVGCVYCLLDFDGHPLYVGQSAGTDERLGARIGRHVLGQRSDAAGRAFPPYEVHSIDIYAMRTPQTLDTALTPAERTMVAQAEAQLYSTLAATAFPPLNERVPNAQGAAAVTLLAAMNVPFTVSAALVADLWHHDVRVERWVRRDAALQPLSRPDLRRYPADAVVAFPTERWIRECDKKARLEGGGFGKPKPTLFPAEYGRHMQRAFRDTLADLLPPEHRYLPTLRIADFEVKPWIYTQDAEKRMRELLEARL